MSSTVHSGHNNNNNNNNIINNKINTKILQPEWLVTSFRVEKKVYEAWVKTVPRKEIGRTITNLLIKDLMDKSGKGQVVLNQSLTQYFDIQTENVVIEKVTVNLEEYDRSFRRYLESWEAVSPVRRKQLREILKKNPGLRDLVSAKELISRLEAD